ncbi:MAG: PEP/pyruvate-binding domain-containing protein, partial [Christensenellales bacterium]
LDTLLHPQFDAAAAKKAEVIGKALGASPGAASGKIVFTAEDAKAEAAKGEKVVLVRLETSPEDIEGMKAAQGILTVRGGMTGVAFTRNPATGEKKLFGEFLTNAQGEDVVAGVRTPMPISEMAEKFPKAFAQFEDVCNILEKHYRDMQDMEFTVENQKLYMLQTRNGKRTASAALKIACDLVDEGMISEQEAVAMIEPRTLDTLLHPQFDA